jgi:hypothetical protein
MVNMENFVLNQIYGPKIILFQNILKEYAIRLIGICGK